MMAEMFPHKFFFEKSFNPIAIYRTDCPASELDASHIIFVDVNPAYERVNRVRKEDVTDRSFADVWPMVEECWSDIIIKCLQKNASVHCENPSAFTGKYLEVIACPISENMAATIFLDRTEWKKSDDKVKRNEKKLLKFSTMLRELATQLTLSEESTRREIATDIHDSIGHSLLTLLLDLHKMRDEHSDLPEDVTATLDNCISSTEEMIASSRELIFQLSPPILLEVGIAPALEMLADHLLTPRGIQWGVTTYKGQANAHPADDSVCVILYRMARELLINVIKHSGASKVSIIINRGPKKIQVVVEDDGKGLPPKYKIGPSSSSGLGLFSIRERLVYIGGEMQIVSGKTGTTVSLLAPLHLNTKKGGSK